jgi:hypothetical protein
LRWRAVWRGFRAYAISGGLKAYLSAGLPVEEVGQGRYDALEGLLVARALLALYEGRFPLLLPQLIRVDS